MKHLSLMLIPMALSFILPFNHEGESKTLFVAEDFGTFVVGAADDSVEFKAQANDPQASSLNDDVTYFHDYDYTPISNFNMQTYFEKLHTYSPDNNLGSCGYVSLIQAMSYYDTFVNDEIIPSAYDKHDSSAKTAEEAAQVSPGVIRDTYYSSTDGTYYNYCHNNYDTDFQCALTVANNQVDGTDNSSNFGFSIGGWDYQKTFNKFYNGNSPLKVVSYDASSQSAYINYIKKSIDNDDPVIVHIKKHDSSGKEIAFHSVVAYDYDSSGIYANFGWTSTASTRQLLLGGSYGYDLITNCYTLVDSSTTHTHSNNYVINGTGYCGCNLNERAKVAYGGDYINVPPTIYWMKNPLDPDETFKVKIADSFFSDTLGGPIETFTTDKNSFTMSIDTRKEIIGSYAHSYYIAIERVGTSASYNEVKTGLSTPDINSSATHITIAPAEYGIVNTYVWNAETATITQGNYTVQTTRKRVGYVENQNINLSANRSGAGEAYIKYDMDTPIRRVDVDLSFWDNYEGFYDATNKSTARFEYLDSNNKWQVMCDLLNDIDMSDSRFDMDRFTFVFPEVTKSIRFISTFDNPTGDSNSGRICIGDISLYFD